MSETDTSARPVAALTPAATGTSTPARVLAVFRSRPWGFAALLAVVLVVANGIAQPAFLSPAQWPVLLGTLAPFVLVALASTPAVLGGGGGIDISIGPLASLVNVVFVVVLLPNGLGSAATSIPLLLALGVGVGVVNGLLVTVARLQPVIATLAMLFVLTGIGLRLAATPSSAARNWTSDLDRMVGVVPGGLLTMAVPALCWFLLGRAGYVRRLYAVGGDDVAAFSAGVSVTRVRIGAYAVAGVFAAVAGIALTALIQSAETSLATTYALIALAGVSLGGTSLAGGRGGLLGSLLGAACIFLLQELLTASGVSTNYLQFAYGTLLITGVVLSARLSRTRPGAP